MVIFHKTLVYSPDLPLSPLQPAYTILSLGTSLLSADLRFPLDFSSVLLSLLF